MTATTPLDMGHYTPYLLEPTKHTPGDLIVANADGCFAIVAPDPKMPGCIGFVATVEKLDFRYQAEANALLFAAAPKLLAALKAIVLETIADPPVKPFSEDSRLPEHLLLNAMAALVEAEGWE